MSQQPSGWYDDPSNPEMLRYWDGVTWTNHTAPKKSPTASQSTIGLPQQAASQAPQVPQPTTPMPQGGAWQGQQAPQYPPQYQQFPQAPGAGWMTAGPVTMDGVPLASWGRRLGAWIIDGIIISIIVGILRPIVVPGYDQAVTDLTNAFSSQDPTALENALSASTSVVISSTLLLWAVASVYAVAFWTTVAQTPGKMLLRISVRHTDRPGPIDLGTAVKRRIIPLVGAFVGLLTIIDGLWPLWDAKRQCLHDKVASTQVVQGKQPPRQG